MTVQGSVPDNNRIMAEGQEWRANFRGQRWGTGREQTPERKWNEEEGIQQKPWSDSVQFLRVAGCFSDKILSLFHRMLQFNLNAEQTFAAWNAQPSGITQLFFSMEICACIMKKINMYMKKSPWSLFWSNEASLLQVTMAAWGQHFHPEENGCDFS